MKANKILNIVSATYLLLCGIVSLFFLVVVYIQNNINTFKSWVSILTSVSIVLLAIINNYKILRNISKINKTNILINLMISVIQIVNVSFNKFQFKFNQGFEVVVYANVNNITKRVDWGTYLSNINYFLNIKFPESNYSVVGVNLLILFFFLFYVYLYQEITHRIVENHDKS